MRDDELLTQNELSDYLGVPVPTIRRWRVSGTGPPFIKVVGHVRYRRRDLDAWLDERSRRSTSEPVPAA